MKKRMRTMSFCKPRKNSVKRFFDLVAAIPSVIILSPVFILIGFFVHMKICSPVLFRQMRPGMHGKLFVIYKFRTMMDKREKLGHKGVGAGRMSCRSYPG